VFNNITNHEEEEEEAEADHWRSQPALQAFKKVAFQ